MNYRSLVIKLFVLLGLAGLAYGTYRYFFAAPEEKMFNAKPPARRNVAQIIRATGSLRPEDMLKVGSLVPGVLQEMIVDENQSVKKGQLLAIVDDGKGDTEVRTAQAELDQTKAELTYLTAFHKRQKALHDEKFISDDEFQRVDRDLTLAQEEIKRRTAKLEYATTIFNRKKIKAPADGIIIGKICSEGEAVTNFGTGTVIYTIAKDIKKMEARIEIDESSVGLIHNGMSVDLVYDAYIGTTYRGVISDISNNQIEKSGTVSYIATVLVDNTQRLLKPGMTVNAEITLAKRENVLTISSQQLLINPAIVEKIAKLKQYAFKPLSPEKKAELLKLGDYKVVWIERQKSFIAQPVKVGISDGAFFEVLEGLTEKDLVIDDTMEENAMDKVFGKFFKTGLQS